MFGVVKLTKNADIDKYGYSGYGIGFDRHGRFSFGNGVGKNNNFWSRYEFIDKDWKQEKGYFNSWKRFNAGIRKYVESRKIVCN